MKNGNSDNILASKFDTVSYSNNVVVMFLEARWVPLLKLQFSFSWKWKMSPIISGEKLFLTL